MKELIDKFSPFILKQTVFIKDGDKITEEKVFQKDLAKFIASQTNVSKIHFFGNEDYAKKIATEFITKYNVTNVEILFNI